MRGSKVGGGGRVGISPGAGFFPGRGAPMDEMMRKVTKSPLRAVMRYWRRSRERKWVAGERG